MGLTEDAGTKLSIALKKKEYDHLIETLQTVKQNLGEHRLLALLSERCCGMVADMVLSVPGVDYESLDRSEQAYAVKRLEAALKAFGPGFHVYQYLFKIKLPRHSVRKI